MFLTTCWWMQVSHSPALGPRPIEALEGEDIRVVVTPWRDARAALRRNRFDNAVTIIALQWLALNRARLRRRWPTA